MSAVEAVVFLSYRKKGKE